MIYVDDIILIGNSSILIDSFLSWLQDEFHVRDVIPLYYFLGIEVNTFYVGTTLCQSKNIHDLIECHGVLGVNSYLTQTTPLFPNLWAHL